MARTRCVRRRPGHERFRSRDPVVLRMTARPWGAKGRGLNAVVTEPLEGLPQAPIQLLAVSLAVLTASCRRQGARHVSVVGSGAAAFGAACQRRSGLDACHSAWVAHSIAPRPRGKRQLLCAAR